MRVLENLEPKDVFYYFEEISNIPRPSYQEKAISDYLMSFAHEHHLEAYQDELYNVIIIKEATAGYEAEEPVILQGHMDMVCEKTGACQKDMEKEGLDLVVDGDYLSAEGTTLGGDDGIAVAYILAILSSDSIPHPRLECVITVSEEVGMDGARGIDLSMLKGHTLLNIDSEKEGELLTSCAGGGRVVATLPLIRETSPEAEAMLPVLVHVHGLIGGHSGIEIDKGRANAVHVLTGALRETYNAIPFRLISMNNGGKDNAIPRDAKALVAIPGRSLNTFKESLAASEKALRAEYIKADPDITIDVLDAPEELLAAPENQSALSADSTKAVLTLISALPNGVQRMSDNIKGLVETSLNLGIVETDAIRLTLHYALRSSVGSAYDTMARKMEWICKALGAEVKRTGEYPAWEFKKESPLREKMVRVYKEMFGKDIDVVAVHAGVECGLLSGKIKNLDAVSIGPDMQDIHTPDERLSISSAKRTYEYVLQVLADRKGA